MHKDAELLRRWFADIGARVKVREPDPMERGERQVASFRVDVRSDRWGEYFDLVVADADLAPDPSLVLEAEPLREGGRKPHVVESLYRRDGRAVYACEQYPNGLSEAERARLFRLSPETKTYKWRPGAFGATVFGKGRVRHPDHKTIVLRGWHRVLLNQEGGRGDTIGFLV